MKQKTFFSITAIVFIIMVGYFSFQLFSLPEKSCTAYFGFECDAYAQLLCLGHVYSVWPLGGKCEDGVCKGSFKI